MNWVDAGRVIATMKNKQAIRYWTDHQFVSDTINVLHLTIHPDNAVAAVRLAISAPKDAARFGFLPNLAEKAMGKKNSLACTITFPRTKSSLAPVVLEVFSARRANQNTSRHCGLAIAGTTTKTRFQSSLSISLDKKCFAADVANERDTVRMIGKHSEVSFRGAGAAC